MSVKRIGVKTTRNQWLFFFNVRLCRYKWIEEVNIFPIAGCFPAKTTKNLFTLAAREITFLKHLLFHSAANRRRGGWNGQTPGEKCQLGKLNIARDGKTWKRKVRCITFLFRREKKKIDRYIPLRTFFLLLRKTGGGLFRVSRELKRTHMQTQISKVCRCCLFVAMCILLHVKASITLPRFSSHDKFCRTYSSNWLRT